MTKSKIKIIISLEIGDDAMIEKLLHYIDKNLIYTGVRNGWYSKFKIVALKELGGIDTEVPSRPKQQE